MDRRPIDDDPRKGAERPSHPRLAAALLMIGIVVLLVLISVVPLL
jgi:hypothetical protein